MVARPLLAVTKVGTLILSADGVAATMKLTSTEGLLGETTKDPWEGVTVTAGFLVTVTVVDCRVSPTQSASPAEADN